MRGGPFRLRLAVSCDAGEGGCPAQLQRVTLGCAASEQVPGAGKGALTKYLERKWGVHLGDGKADCRGSGKEGVRSARRVGPRLECPL